MARASSCWPASGLMSGQDAEGVFQRKTYRPSLDWAQKILGTESDRQESAQRKEDQLKASKLDGSVADGSPHSWRKRIFLFHTLAFRSLMPTEQNIAGSADETQTRRLLNLFSFLRQSWLHIQNEVNGGPQKVRSVGFGHYRIHTIQGSIGQFKVVGQHDNRNVWPNLLDRTGNGCAIEKAEMVFEHNCIDGPRHKNSQTFRSIGCGHQVVSLLL